MNDRLNAVKGRANGMLSGFTTGQKAIVAVAVVGLVLGAFYLTRLVGQPSYAPLFGGLSGEDANAITEQLNTDGVPYQLANSGTTIMVPQDQVYAERIKVAAAGLPANDSEGGYSLLDKQGITATDFQQNVAYQRAVEGELAKTLEAMDPVQTAVVHLAIPQRDVFATDEDKPTASVLLSLKGGKTLTADQVTSVTRLVGGAVPNLDPSDVSVSDSTGKLLSDNLSSSGMDEANAAYESRLTATAQAYLDKVLGPGHSAVQVAATMDTSSSDSTSETYDANSKVPPASESKTSEQYSNGSASGVNGTLGQVFAGTETLDGGGTGSNTTNQSSTSGTGSGSYLKTTDTTNNNVGKTVTRTTTGPGTVKKLSVAVAIDSKTAGAYDPAQLQQQIANAVGLDTTRGDTVDVKKLPFDTTASAAAAKELAAAQSQAQMGTYIGIAKQAGLGLLILAALFIAMRATRRKKKDETTVEATAIDLPNGAPELLGGATVALPGTAAALPAGTSAVNAQNALAQLVEESPEDVAAMLQGWLGEGRR